MADAGSSARGSLSNLHCLPAPKTRPFFLLSLPSLECLLIPCFHQTDSRASVAATLWVRQASSIEPAAFLLRTAPGRPRGLVGRTMKLLLTERYRRCENVVVPGHEHADEATKKPRSFPGTPVVSASELVMRDATPTPLFSLLGEVSFAGCDQLIGCKAPEL